MRTRRLTATVVAAILSIAAVGSSAEVATEPESPLFDEMIRPRLTSIDDLLELDIAKSEERADGGVLLLEEEVRVVSSNAQSVVAFHRVIKPTTDAGVELASQLIIPFDTSSQSVSLVAARTHQPDGKSTDINRDAAFIQTPQHQADQGIYTDTAELVVLFSNVKVGHLIEYLVVFENHDPRMPGHWGTIILPGAYWPTVRFRSSVTVEQPLADKVRIAPLGSPLPESAEQTAPSGWRSWTWAQDHLPPLTHEIERAPTAQTGPAIRLTTVESWDEFAAWYTDLLGSTGALTPEIADLVDGWTAGVEDGMEILTILHQQVADEVRYTGLEFGIGALKPRAPEEVWSSLYGDCKDKANLLRVMLAHRGIESRMVLVNTNHAGWIDERTPHYNQFNHAILAVDIDGETIFCDPTVPSSSPGLLPPQDTGRTVLLIGRDRGDLFSLPGQSAGELHYSFDLEVAADGRLSGWLEISAHGIRGARLTDYFRHLDGQSRQQRFHSFTDLFFEGSELIDVEFPAVGGSAGSEFSARGYFVVGGARGSDDSGAVLRFPHGGMVFPYLDDRKERATKWYQEVRSTRVKMRYLLPTGWHERNPLPKPLKITSPTVAGEARWSNEDGVLLATMDFRTLEDLVDREEYSRFRQAVVAMRTWMDEPVMVAPSEGSRPDSPATVDVAMPMMPTGEGQLRLVDKLYPVGGDPDRRRAALLQAQQFFPDSSETTFDVQVWLAQLDGLDGQPDMAVSRIQRAIETYGDRVSRESTAWARYHLAHHELDTGDEETAIAEFESLAGDSQLTSFRRATAYEMLAVIHADNGNDELALQALDLGLALDSGMESELQDLRARILISADRSADLEQLLRREFDEDPPGAQWTYQILTTTVSDLAEEGYAADATSLAGVLLTLAESESSLSIGDDILESLAELSRTTEAYTSISLAIAEYLESEAPQWLREVEDAVPSQSFEDVSDAMDRFDTEGRYPEYVRSGLEILARYPNMVDDFGDLLWQIAVVVEDRPSHDGLLRKTIGWGMDLPTTDDYFFEMIIVEARRLDRAGESDKALALLQEWTAAPETNAVYRVAFLSRIGLLYESLEDWEAALAAYRELEPDRDSNLSGYDAVLRAVYINLGLGRQDEALRLVGILSDLGDESLSYCDSPAQIRELVGLAANPELAKRFWALERDWMPVWRSLERAVGIEPSPDVAVPIIPDAYELGVELGSAMRVDAPQTYFEAYRTAIQSARWQPEMVFEICALAGQATRMAPEHGDLVEALVVGLTSGLDIGDDLIYKRSRVVLANHYLENQQFHQVLAIGREYFERFDADDVFGQAILRLWGLAGVYSDLDQEPAIERLREVLATHQLEGSRTVTVYVLAKLYQDQGLRDDELALIELEIINGTTDNQLYGERLSQRYAELSTSTDGDSGFTEAVNEWMESHAPSWYETAAPATLDDPLARRIERDIDDNSDRFETTELIKYRLLVALDPSRPEDDRQEALSFAVSDLVSLSNSIAEADAMLEALVDDQRVPRFVREFPLKTSLREAFDRNNAGRIARWMETTTFQSWSVAERTRFRRLRDGIPSLDDDSDTLAAKASALLEDELDDTAVRVLRKTIERMLQIGEIDSVDSIIGDLGDAVFDTIYEPAGAGLRLELRRLLETHRSEWPAREAMRTSVFEGIGRPLPEPPPSFADLADTSRIDFLPQEEAFAIRLRQLEAREIRSPMHFFWHSLMSDLRDLGYQEIARLALESGVASVDDDDVQSGLVLFLSTVCFDIDDSTDRARFEKLLTESLEGSESPASRASAAYISAAVSARTGESFDIDSTIEAAETIGREDGAIRLRLARARHAGRTALRRELESIPAEALVDSTLIPIVLPSLREVGLDDEADLVAEVGADLAQRNMLRTWSYFGMWTFRSTLRLCTAVGDPTCLDPGWTAYMKETLGNQGLALELQLTQAELQNDWSAARETAAELISRRPRFYDLYWHLGRAEAELGHTVPATEALEIFLSYCNDSVFYDQANRLLDSLSTPEVDDIPAPQKSEGRERSEPPPGF